jgi:hypothetical protein
LIMICMIEWLLVWWINNEWMIFCLLCKQNSQIIFLYHCKLLLIFSIKSK